MNEDKFKTLIDNFSPSLLAETFQRSHDFFRIKQNLLPTFSDKQFADFSQLGDFELEDNTSVVVICARSLTHLNERASRKAQYDISKKILKSFLKSRAGMFIYYDSKGDFRISLIYADYVGVKVNYSTFRRFTYFVSKEQTNTTFFQQVAPFNFTNFQELREVFSVEKVTKEFFKKYRDLFGDLLEDFDNNEVFKEVVIEAEITNTADFVKKLMGQIVFLYFVQKKGWLGVRPNENWGTGSQTFLRFLFSTCAKANKNYYNDYLEPLFYDALAEKRDKDYFELFNCRVPFLNGGLFESVYDWKNTNIDIPNKTTGKLLDFFDQYNFTVDENTPSDQEISIDPEMLGKIFENLLDVKDRKDKGAFYTPREIVHYMCRESLIQHLVSENTAPEERIRKLFEIKDTDLSLVVEDEKKIEIVKRLPELKEISEKVDFSLRNIKIVDPAVGSGAFPMGMLNEISSIRYYLNTNFLHTKNKQDKELTLYDIKKETLENCIYAVDIDPGAVEIAKLRFWLALIVEYNADDLENSPPTLPNLDYKIMQGNSLLEEYEGIKLFDEKILQSPIINAEILDPKNQHITKLQTELLQFYMKNPNWMKKGIHKDKPNEVIELETRLRDYLKQNKKIKEDSTEQKDLFTTTAESKKIWETIKSKHKLLFSESNKEKKQDLRKQIEDLNWQLIESTLEEQGKSLEIEKLKELRKSKIKPFFLWRMHFAEVFEEKGGFDVVIGNPPYISYYSKQARPLSKEEEMSYKNSFEFIGDKGKKGRFNTVMFFLEKGMKLTGNNGTLSFIIDMNIFENPFYDIRKFITNNYSIRELILDLVGFEGVNSGQVVITLGNDTPEEDHELIYKNNKFEKVKGIKQKEISKNDFNWLNFFDNKINNKILKKSTPLLSLFPNKLIRTGITFTGKKKEFIINDDNLIKYKILSQNIYPLYEGSDAFHKPYEYPKATCKINYDLSVVKKLNEEYRASNNSDKSPMVIGLADLIVFKNPRILIRLSDSRITATYSEDIAASDLSLYSISNINSYDDSSPINLKYILSILNSNFITYYALTEKLISMGEKKTPQIRLKSIKALPIIVADNQKSFIDLVDKILNITKTEDYFTNTENQAGVKKLEHQIDELVYKLYDLTPEEIEIVENSSKK